MSVAGVSTRRSAALTALAVGLGALTLAVAPAAKPDAASPVVSLGPVSIANGTATLSGSVTGSPAAAYQLHVNGRPLGINADGTFSGTVDLAGQSVLTITARNPLSGEIVTTQIPLTTNLVGSGGLIPGTVLDALKRAGITLTIPEGGFASLDGLPIGVEGRVLDRDELASLRVNGVDVLDQLGESGAFSQSVPGTSREVSVSATDRQGVAQTTTYSITPLSSVIATTAGPSVAAAGADGVQIAKVRYLTKTVKTKKRFRMIVTVKDRQGRLVRNAIVRVRPTNSQARKRFVIGNQRTKRSSKIGEANFLVLVRKHALGKRLFMITVAQTPKARAEKTTSVRLPTLARTRAQR